MNKNTIKRAYLNITRKKSKSVIFLIIMFVMANMVLSSLSISQAVEETTEYAKDSLGSTVYLNADMTSMRDSFSGGKISGEMPDISSISRPSITLSIVEAIAESSYVNDYSYTVSVSGETDLELYSSEQFSFGRQSSSGLTITGVNSLEDISGIDDGTIEIDDEVYIDEYSENAIIISYEFAILNDLSVGSEIVITNSETLESFTYEIISLFTSTISGNENSIYTNIESSLNLITSNQMSDGEYIVSDVAYYLSNPDDVDLFIEEQYELIDFESESLTLSIDTQAYDAMAGSIEQVGSFSNTILIVVIVAAVLILSLIINNNIKERKYEMGVLMSLGARKKDIILQIFLELAIISTLAFVLSLGTSNLVANSLSDSLISSQSDAEINSNSSFERPNSQMPEFGENMTQSNVEEIDEIDVSVSANEFMLLFVIGYIIVFLSMSLPIYNITKYEPKTILSRRE